MLVGLLPNRMAMLHIIGRVGGIVDADNQHQQPGQRNENAVGSQGRPAMGLMSGEWIIWIGSKVVSNGTYA